jgi:hypothetical protein
MTLAGNREQGTGNRQWGITNYELRITNWHSCTLAIGNEQWAIDISPPPERSEGSPTPPAPYFCSGCAASGEVAPMRLIV